MRYTCYSGYLSTVISESELINVLTPAGGIFKALKAPGEEVRKGEVIGQIIDPFTAEITHEITAAAKSMVFFAMEKPLVLEHEIAFKLVCRKNG